MACPIPQPKGGDVPQNIFFLVINNEGKQFLKNHPSQLLEE